MRMFSFILCFVFPCLCKAGVIRVGPGEQAATITGALSIAKPYDTILVKKAVYQENNLVIRIPVTLKGVDMPVLDGEGKYEIISVKASDVVIDGFRMMHTGVSGMTDFAAVKIYESRNVSVINNEIVDAFFGIYSQYGINCLIQNNKLTGQHSEEQQSGNGIHCWKSDSMRIIGNTITGHRDGIYFEFVTHSVIWRNYSTKNLRYGLHFMFSNDDAYITNIFENNGAGVAVMFSHGVKMFNNRFAENWGDAAYGLLLKEISDSYICGNQFERNTMAIYAEGASRITMTKNKFSGNGWGIKVQASCMDIGLSDNNFIGNSFDIGTNGSLVLNNFNGNYWDKYDGYDLNKDGLGDIPYHPVSLFGMIVEKDPPAMILFHSFITSLMDKTEKLIPGITPEDLKDEHPLMKPLPL